MNPAKGYYSLIQYCPDLSRLEAANVGVLLFCPEHQFLRALTTASNDRIRKFFGSQDNDWTQINAIKESIENRLKAEGNHFRTLEDLETFIATRANQIQMTSPRPMKVLQPEEDLKNLFEELVGGRRRRTPRSVQKIERTVGDALAGAGVERYLRKDVTVTLSVLHSELRVPFGYQNGRFNLIKPSSFLGLTENGVLGRACRDAVTGHSLYRRPDPVLGEMQLVLIGQFDPEMSDGAEIVRGIMLDHDVRLYTVDDLNPLLDEIRTTGRPICS